MITKEQFDETQIKAYDSALRAIANCQVFKIGGYAGCGKTTIAFAIARDSGLSYKGCSYIGKAVSQLRRKGLKDAQTIHRTMYEWDDSSETFFKKPHLNCQLLAIDEGSMVPTDLWNDVKSYHTGGQGLRAILILGDPGQLQPIGEDAKLMHSPDVLLEKIHRYEGSIAWFAQQIRLTGTIPRIDTPEVSVRSKAMFLKDLTGTFGLSTVVLCGYNKTRVATNRYIRSMLGRVDDITVGERLIGLRNNYQVGIFNGQMMEVLEATLAHDRKYGKYTQAKVMLDDGNIQSMKLWHGHLHVPGALDWRKCPERMAVVDYAYCTTVHKFQGSEMGHVMVIDEACDLWDQTRHRYTAATRAEERLQFYVD